VSTAYASFIPLNVNYITKQLSLGAFWNPETFG
jgi:hypothetical protein